MIVSELLQGIVVKEGKVQSILPCTKYLVILLILLGGAAVLLLGAEGEPDGADLDRAAGPQRPRDGAAGVCVFP